MSSSTEYEQAARFHAYLSLVRSDLHRAYGRQTKRAIARVLATNLVSRYIFLLRTTQYLASCPWFLAPLRLIVWIHYRGLSYKLGIFIPTQTKIQSGLVIAHPGCIFVNGKCTIGRNCTLSQGVTLGKANRGKRKGYPTIGDNVYIGPGAKVIGSVQVGDNVAIGANCVVTHDAPDFAVVVGVPGRVISLEGSDGYISRTDYLEPA